MFSEISTYILYNVILFCCPLLCFLGQKFKKKGFVFLAYIIILFVTIFRYDIGADYQNYALESSWLQDVLVGGLSLKYVLSEYLKEPFFVVLTYIFSWSDDVFVWVLSIYNSFSIILFYKILERYNIHAIGLFVYISTCILFQNWDWVRQSLVMFIFIYSLRYIENRCVWKYMLSMLVSFFIHYSALVLIPVYYFNRIKINVRILPILLSIAFVMAEIGVFTSINNLISQLMSLYYGFPPDLSAISGEGGYRSMAYVLRVLWYISILFFSSNVVEKHMSILYFIGALLFVMAPFNLYISRLGFYFASLQIVIVPILLKKNVLSSFRKQIVVLLLVMQIAVYNKFISLNINGCMPYQTIFSEEFDMRIFRVKDY